MPFSYMGTHIRESINHHHLSIIGSGKHAVSMKTHKIEDYYFGG